MQQAARVSDYTAFMYLGELIEFGATKMIFKNPTQEADRRLHHRPLRLTRRPAFQLLCPSKGYAAMTDHIVRFI